ncbi:hypothetical protein [Pseudomonas fluorescens]|uniref:hypothetical protein n=1 Tax=Pseudomonas fluorescens TaxID=294 RepID=UPI00123F5346|nr:hypothetical protein [Pseudomonas fluorescens]
MSWSTFVLLWDFPDKHRQSAAGAVALIAQTPVGAAEGCDLLILIFKSKIKRSQPSATPTGDVFSQQKEGIQSKPRSTIK